jgi:Chaperone of endosialidase
MTWTWYKPWTYGDESDSAKQQRSDLNNQANQADALRDYSTTGFGALGTEGDQMRGLLRDQATGKTSFSGEQLRQGLMQQQAAQQSMAAGASPGNSVMAARTAAMQMGRNSATMNGQAAMAGIAERQAAAKAWADALLQQRQQNMQAALQSSQNATSALTGAKPEGSTLDKWGPAISAGAAAAAKSDERAKEDIAPADDTARETLEQIGSYTYRYKDEADGKGQQFGVMAQELERAGLAHVVIDTPNGKFIDGAKLETTNLALIASLARRVAELEKK